MTEKLNNLLHEVETAAANYVAAKNDHKPKATCDQLKKAAASAVAAFNRELEIQTYREWLAAGDPVKTAIRERVIHGAKRVSYKEADSGAWTATIKDTDIGVDLPMLQRVVGAAQFHDPNWSVMVENLGWIMAANLNEHIANNPAFAYAVSEAAKAFKFPEEITSDSDEAVFVALQMCIDAVLYIPDEKSRKKSKPNLIAIEIKTDKWGRKFSPQWEVIKHSMTQAGGRSQVEIHNTSKLAEYIADAMHQILTNGNLGLVSGDNVAIDVSPLIEGETPDPAEDQAEE